MHDLKRAATILFSFVYLMATSGILVGQHLCMGRVKHSALFQKTEKKCGMSGEEHKGLMPCCEDVWSLEKVEDDQQAGSLKKAPDTRYHLLYAITFSELIVNPGSQEEELEVNDTGPPHWIPADLNILFHNLKIPAALQS